MALAMDDTAARRTWFGFSPTLVVVLVLALAGGGVAYARSGPPSYDEGVRKMCAEALAWKGGIDARQADNPSATPTTFTLVGDLAEVRIRGLERLQPTGDEVARHKSLLATERELLADARATDAVWQPRAARSQYRGVRPDFERVYNKALLLNLHYERNFDVKKCAD